MGVCGDLRAPAAEVSAACAMVNAFSVDVEGFIEGNQESWPAEVRSRYLDRPLENREIETNTHAVLQLLDDAETRATFFFLGRIARDLPALVRDVAKARHEVACHGDEHRRVFAMSPVEFRERVTAAKGVLEDVSGREVCGFRAPDFSVVRSSMWALDVLREAGFLYDSSVYPIGVHDVYGIPDAERFVHRMPNGLVEFPLPTIEVLGARLPFGGGGYFRLYPRMVTKALIARWNAMGQPCMFYVHPYEVGPVQPNVGGLPRLRRFRHYYRSRRGDSRVRDILQSFAFGSALEVLRRTHALTR
jgi:polysaccharide deacetylase family protein (PEP-CTERM system associated)